MGFRPFLNVVVKRLTVGLRGWFAYRILTSSMNVDVKWPLDRQILAMSAL